MVQLGAGCLPDSDYRVPRDVAGTVAGPTLDLRFRYEVLYKGSTFRVESSKKFKPPTLEPRTSEPLNPEPLNL